ncbi:MAG: PilZ domain-containing protein [Geothrix sp.]|uniref:PilZ domain-containing protein n=1 Tax=Geothrix sp. TaxID=1962974 RepID=UPI00181353C0|nr:PilZ domain-containing protein [Geothrix sp.]NWJ42335.1 PilZ domain-containing protein [Geothrix sp.]WIL19697.1 MAG: PilZ domain-containing protein [Geothrix sp.]
MGHASHLSAPVLEQFLHQARLTRAVASLRLQDANARLLGDLRIHGFRAGSTLELSGLHVRDSVPADGTAVTLTILLGDEVLTLESLLLSPVHDGPGGTLLRLDWPHESARLHHRRDVRVAGPDQTPLKVRVGLGGRQLEALLVNLTETGVGLALNEPLMVDLHAQVDIDAELPDGAVLRCPGEVLHLTYLQGQDYPTRLGVVLHPRPDTDLEPIHRFIQARRTDRSQSFRRG